MPYTLKRLIKRMQPIKLSEAVDQYLSARRLSLSPHTLSDYGLTLRRLTIYLDLNPALVDITSAELTEFLLTIPGEKKNKKNAYIALSAFWSWCIKQEIAREHILRKIDPPKPVIHTIMPFDQADVNRLLSEVRKRGRNQKRDLAMILVFVDTGVRVSELVGLKLGDLEGSCLKVLGKGSKERLVPMSSHTMAAILDYLATRKGQPRKAVLFCTEEGRQFSRRSLYQVLDRIADSAGVEDVYPHRFRHTFAINYLRNGGDAYTLQKILGHSSMDMVKRYLDIVDGDIATVHRRASPVANWHL